MTRREAVYELEQMKTWSKDLSDNEIEALVMALKALSSSENPNRWVPVSKRLPEKFRFVNCTCHSLIDDREDWVIETVYVPQPSNSPYSDWGNIPMLNKNECEVIAWMYRDIPEPYRETLDNIGGF